MRKKQYRTIVAGMLLLASVSTSSNALELLVPAYANPCCADGPQFWQNLIDTARSSNDVKLHVIFNPASGPGTAVDVSYLMPDGSGPLADISVNDTFVYGYVTTGYASRSLVVVKEEIDLYFDTLYSGYVGHIFLDEMSNDLQHSGYYREITDYIKSKNTSAGVIGNPGVSSTENVTEQTLYSVNDYVNSVDIIVTFEHDAGEYMNNYVAPSWIEQADAQQFAHIVYAATWDTQLAELLATRKAGLFYVTDDGLSNPYDQLPSYWSQLVDNPTVAEYTQSIYPTGLKERRGDSSDQDLLVLTIEDQSGYADDWSNYREFYTQRNGYRGDFTFSLPEGVDPADVVSMKIEANYRGQTASNQLWNWRMHNFTQRSWTTVGTNNGASDWQWSHFSFPLEASPQQYLTKRGRMRVRFETASDFDNGQLDYLSIVLKLQTSLDGA